MWRCQFLRLNNLSINTEFRSLSNNRTNWITLKLFFHPGKENPIRFQLTFPVPCISESCIEIKIKLNFYFHTSLCVVLQKVLWRSLSMDYDCHISLKYLVFHIKNLVFQPKYLVFLLKTWISIEILGIFELEILKY